MTKLITLSLKPFSNCIIWHSLPSSVLASSPTLFPAARPLKWNALNILRNYLQLYELCTFLCASVSNILLSSAAFEMLVHFNARWSVLSFVKYCLNLSFINLSRIVDFFRGVSVMDASIIAVSNFVDISLFFFWSPFLGFGYWKANAMCYLRCWNWYSFFFFFFWTRYSKLSKIFCITFEKLIWFNMIYYKYTSYFPTIRYISRSPITMKNKRNIYCDYMLRHCEAPFVHYVACHNFRKCVQFLPPLYIWGNWCSESIKCTKYHRFSCMSPTILTIKYTTHFTPFISNSLKNNTFRIASHILSMIQKTKRIKRRITKLMQPLLGKVK